MTAPQGLRCSCTHRFDFGHISVMIACSVFSTSTKILEDILNYSFQNISQQTTKQKTNLESFKWQVAKAQMRLHDERLTWTF